MTRSEFIKKLKKSLSHLPRQEIKERISFYNEMIDDLMEEGYSEEEAVSKIGPIEETISNVPTVKKASKRLRAWEITLLILGFPLWFPLLLAAFSIILSVYISIWAIIISQWACFASLVACALGGVLSGILFTLLGMRLTGTVMIASALVCAGLSILFFFLCRILTRLLLTLTKTIFTRKRRDVK